MGVLRIVEVPGTFCEVPFFVGWEMKCLEHNYHYGKLIRKDYSICISTV